MRSFTAITGSLFLTGVLLGACHGEPSVDAGVPLTCPDTPPSPVPAPEACVAQAVVDPSVAADQARFRENASAVVCDWSLRCQGLAAALGQSFCHPGFAAHRAGDVAHDAAAAERCLSALTEVTTCADAFEVAFACLAVSDGHTGRPCSDTNACWALYEVCDETEGRCRWLDAGEACTDDCGPGLTCVRGECRKSIGCSCEVDGDCASWMRCVDGTCRTHLEGERCSEYSCVEGLYCDDARRCAPAARTGEACGDVPCRRGRCSEEGVCVAQRHIGCECNSDSQCPADVGRCVDGVCVARPMEGEPCEPGGAACFGSGCYDGQCGPFRDGDGPCRTTSECATGLTCSRAFLASGLCGPPRAEGEPCGPSLPGACDRGLICTTSDAPVCAQPAAVGETCSDRPCENGSYCDASDVCVADSP